MDNLNKKYTVTLADGTVITDLTLNGNNYISKTEINKEVFEDNLYSVTISDGETEEVHSNMELIQLQKYGEEYWFILRDIPSDILEKMKIQADIAYVAMMAGVKL